MEFNFTIKNDKLTSTAYPKGVTGNVNTYTCRFNIECDIAGLIWFCIFKQGDNVYNQIIEDNTCVMPYEVLTNAEPLYIGCYGTNGDDDIKRVSTNFICFDVKQGAYSEANAPETPTPDIWESLINKNIPYIGDNGNWFIYDVEQKTYVDSGNKSQGEKGEQGIQGEKGDKGEDGYTPIRGVDYWTEADQNQISADLDEKIANKAEQVELERLNYYEDSTIVPSPESYFTVNSTGETITGLTDTGKTQTELVIPYEINGVKNTTLDNSGTSILAGATDKITKVIIPNSIVTIGNNAFQYCTLLSSINIPSSVTSISNGAFQNCTALTSINIPNRVTSIGNSAFNSCTALTSINIPNGVTSIGDSAFVYCSGLKSITIPNSVRSIDNYAFGYCTSLTSIIIPNSVTSIGNSAFEGCTNLTIYCEQGSYAENFANTNNIPVKYTDISAIEFKNKADKATTLSGYGITDAYTKTEVEAYINETILGGAW